jgi:hypothetical protein
MQALLCNDPEQYTLLEAIMSAVTILSTPGSGATTR